MEHQYGFLELSKIFFPKAALKDREIRFRIAVIVPIAIIHYIYLNTGFPCAVTNIGNISAESARLYACMIIAIKFAQSVIALFKEVVKVEFTPKVTETIVQYFVSNLRVFIACQGVMFYFKQI